MHGILTIPDRGIPGEIAIKDEIRLWGKVDQMYRNYIEHNYGQW